MDSTSLKQMFESRRCQGETARDFLARERTFFSWLRLSQTLSILSGAILLRLKPRSFPKPKGQVKNRNKKRDQISHQRTRRFRRDSPLNRYLLRKIGEHQERASTIQSHLNLKEPRVQSESIAGESFRSFPQDIIHSIEKQQGQSHQGVALQFNCQEWGRISNLGPASRLNPTGETSFSIPESQLLSASSLSTIPHSTSDSIHTDEYHSTTSKNPLATNHKLSVGLGVFFFLISILSLSLSFFDYLKCVRYLELTDRDEVEGILGAEEPQPLLDDNRHSNGNPGGAEEGEGQGDCETRRIQLQIERERRCDAVIAGMAQTSKMIKILEAILCISIGTLAILLLVFQRI